MPEFGAGHTVIVQIACYTAAMVLPLVIVIGASLIDRKHLHAANRTSSSPMLRYHVYCYQGADVSVLS